MDNSKGKLYLAYSLIDCIEDNNLKNLKVVLSNDADPDIIIPERGITPFHLIAGSENVDFALEVIKLFLQRGANPNVKSSDGLTPVHIASAWGKTRILHLLLMNGGNPWQQDDLQKNAFQYAFEEKQWKVMDLLQKYRLYNQNKNEDEEDIKYKYEKLETYLNLPPSSPLIKVNRSIQTSVLILNTMNTNREITDKIASNKALSENNTMINNSEAKQQFLAAGDVSTSFITELKSKLLDRSRESTGTEVNGIPKRRITNKIKGISDTLVGLLPKSTQTKLRNPNYIDDSLLEINHLPPPIEPEKITYPPKSPQSPSTSFPAPPPLPPPKSPPVEEIFETGSRNNLLQNDELSIAEHDQAFIDEWIASESCEIPNIKDDNKVKQFNNPSSTESESLDYYSFSATEEYKYTDEEKGIVLYEKHFIKLPKEISNKEESESDMFESLLQPYTSDESDAQTSDYATDSLRQQLTNKGYTPGPILPTTKKLYIHKLRALRREPLPPPPPQHRSAYSPELELTLTKQNWHECLQEHTLLERQLTEQFSTPDPQRRWREGVAKTSFCYLLLDPRRTRNFPCQTDILTFEQTWETFLSSIFYVGKGKRSRPYAHLYEAVTHYHKSKNDKSTTQVAVNSKMNYILDIWNSGGGVVCLHLFQNIIPVEAFTREAAMIEALGLNHLKNSKTGEYYGVAASWNKKQKRMLGIYLLYRAMAIFINEGERQIRPGDIN